MVNPYCCCYSPLAITTRSTIITHQVEAARQPGEHATVPESWPHTETGERKPSSSTAEVAEHPWWQSNASLRLRLRCRPLHPPAACCHRDRVAAAQTRQTGHPLVTRFLKLSVTHRRVLGKTGKVSLFGIGA